MPVCANQLVRLSCLVVRVKFQFVYNIRRKVDSQLLLASVRSNVLLARGSEKGFNDFLGVSIVCRLSLTVTPQVTLFGKMLHYKSSFIPAHRKQKTDKTESFLHPAWPKTPGPEKGSRSALICATCEASLADLGP